MNARREEAIVLSRGRRAGQGRTISFLTPGTGLVRAYQGRRTRRSPGGLYEPFWTGELLFLPATDRAPARILSFYLEDSWPRIRGDLEILAHLFPIVEVVERVATEGDPHSGLFPLMRHLLSRLDADCDPAALHAVALFKILDLAGLSPRVDRCLACGSPPGTARAVLSPAEGGVRCRACAAGTGGALEVSAGARSFMAASARLAPERMGRLRLGRAVRPEVLAAAEALAAHALLEPPRAPRPARQLARAAAFDNPPGHPYNSPRIT